MYYDDGYDEKGTLELKLKGFGDPTQSIEVSQGIR